VSVDGDLLQLAVRTGRQLLSLGQRSDNRDHDQIRAWLEHCLEHQGIWWERVIWRWGWGPSCHHLPIHGDEEPMLSMLLVQRRYRRNNLQLELPCWNVHSEIPLRQLWVCGYLQSEPPLMWDRNTIKCPNEKGLNESISEAWETVSHLARRCNVDSLSLPLPGARIFLS
jgi:hypothetical protein